MARGLNRRACFLALSLSLLMTMVGCGGASPVLPTSPAVTLALASPTTAQTVRVNGALPIIVSIANATNTGVTWAVNGIVNGNPTYGTITGSGLSVTYNAPDSVPSPATFSVTGTSVADSAKSASLRITIAAAAVVDITNPSNPASVDVSETLPITASVTNAEPDLTWTVNGVANGNSTYGTIAGAYPDFTYTPPLAVPGGSNPVTIVATQGATSQSASLTVMIVPSANTPTPIKVAPGGGNATGINLSLPISSSLTLALADVGSCVGDTCSASVSGIQVSRSGLATAECANATCRVWLLGAGFDRLRRKHPGHWVERERYPWEHSGYQGWQCNRPASQ